MARRKNKANKLAEGQSGNEKESQPPKGQYMARRANVYYSKKQNPQVALQPGTPKLVAVTTNGYSLSRKIINEFYKIKAKFSVYLVWLDCLYEDDVKYSTIMANLDEVLTSDQKMNLPSSKVFIVAHQEENGYIRPAGSCLLVFKPSTQYPETCEIPSKKIFDSGLHITKLNFAYLLDQLRFRKTLVFASAFSNIISNMNVNALKKFRNQSGASTSSSSTTRTPAEMEQPAGQSQNVLKVPALTEIHISNAKNIKPALVKAVQPAPPQPQKSKRIAATLDGLKKEPTKQKAKPKAPVDLATFEADLFEKLQNDVDKRDFVGDMLPKLASFGSTVLKIENLPAKISIHAFNLMMGTYSIQSDQLVAINVPDKGGRDTMNLRLVTVANSPDIKQIMDKNKRRTAYDTILKIEMTTFKELENWLATNRNKIRHLVDDLVTKPVTAISYGAVATRVF